MTNQGAICEVMDRRDAEERATALDAALTGSTAAAHYLAGNWYIVTSGTGEGYDFAYDVSDVDLTDVARRIERDEQGDYIEGTGWDYSEWCSRTSPCEDLDVAVAYYLATGDELGVDGATRGVLTASQMAALDCVEQEKKR